MNRPQLPAPKCRVRSVLSKCITGGSLALIAVLVFKWPLYLCILFVSLNDIVKLIMTVTRVFSRKWINIYRQDYM